jgi:hypothetical protein
LQCKNETEHPKNTAEINHRVVYVSTHR